jgi:23S rRNA (guanosine2251-2'-O)-methyltransferase
MIKEKDDMIFGLRPLIEAVDRGKEIEKVFIKSGLQSDLYREMFEKIKKRNIPFQFVPIEKLNRITRKNHQGVIAYVSLVEFQAIENIVPMLFEQGKTPLILLLDGVTDVRNFGAIVRTAECAGIHAVVIPQKNAARINADAVKTSAGAMFNMNICKVKSLNATLEFLKNSGLQVIAATEKSDRLYHQADYAMPTVLLLGSEDTGIAPGLLELSDASVCIPLLGKTASLNVGSAAAIIMYEAVKQRDALA